MRDTLHGRLAIIGPVAAVVLAATSAVAAAQQEKTVHVPSPDPQMAEVPKGYRVEVLLQGLTYPSSIEFDAQGNSYVAEAGYSYGDETAVPRIFAVSPTCHVQVFVEQGLSGPVNDLLWHGGRLYVSHRGKLSVVEGGRVRDLVTGLPSLGDHHNNQIAVGPDGKLYFGQGTATNSGVVGLDNLQMGWLKKHRHFHDVPARDFGLTEQVFPTLNPFAKDETQAKTSAFQPFGKQVPSGTVVRGQVKASGTILRVNPDGSGLEVFAWGLRNPYGLIWGPDGNLYASENGFDARGSRPIANDLEDLYVIRQGAWYGWPDYASGIPVTDPRFAPELGPKPEFLMQDHPPVEKPIMSFPKHSAVAKCDFSPGGAFGHQGKLFLALFGHMAPMTGQVEQHGGHRVVMIDVGKRTAETFFTKKEHGHGKKKDGHAHGDSEGQKKETAKQGTEHVDSSPKDESVSPGPRRLIDVRFSPKADALYVVDFGSMIVSKEKVQPIPRTGVVWRIVPEGVAETHPPSGLMVPGTEKEPAKKEHSEMDHEHAKSPETKAAPAAGMPEPMMMRCRMLSSMRVDATDPGAVLTLKKELQLTQEQVLALQEIEAQARKAAVQVLKKEQMMKLQPLAETPNNVMDMHRRMMQGMQSDRDQATKKPSQPGKPSTSCPMMEMMEQMERTSPSGKNSEPHGGQKAHSH